MSREEASSITVPTLIAVGSADDIAGSAQRLSEVIPNSQVLDIPHRDHMRAVGDKVYKEGVAAFLENRD
jgi:pimeloyl-ACP methyl ester carboxylesterase